MKKSAGILPYRQTAQGIEVFLVHPGGPFWKKKDEHAWSVPKGEFSGEEVPFVAALREFQEETGFHASGDFLELEPVKLPGGKILYVWAVEADFDPSAIISNTFSLKWPPRSGKTIDVPEVDKAGWFAVPSACHKIHKGQFAVLEQLAELLNV